MKKCSTCKRPAKCKKAGKCLKKKAPTKVRSYSMSKKKSSCAKSFRAGMNIGRNMKKKKK